MTVHVIDEANRCLNCKKPMCRQGCPIQTPIPMMIKAFKEGNLNEAGEMLFSNNPMSMICSLVCNHEKQCEGHCVLGRKGEPVHISSIENYVSDTYFDKMKIECAPSNGKKVAVIGAGPAGIKIRPNTTIGGALEIKDLFRDGYESIFIGTGVWRPKKLSIKGESLGNVHFAIDYLANPDSYELGDTVAIIGMGNSAMDVARTALRKGARNVTLYARGLKSQASAEEIAYAKVDGAVLSFGMQPVEITDDGPVFQKVLFDEEGNRIGVDETPIQVHADSTIVSVSQGPKDKLVSTTEGLKASANGLLVTNQFGETTHPGIFAAGDVVLGAKTVVEATAYAKVVAEAMDQYMQGTLEEKLPE